MSTDCREASRVVVGVGIDTADVSEVASAMRRHQHRYLRFVLSRAERHEAALAADQVAAVARRWAAKEAVTKVLAPGPDERWAWPEIEVLGLGTGSTGVRLHGRAAELAEGLGIDRFEIEEHRSGPAVVTMTAVGMRDTLRHDHRQHMTERQTSS